MNLTELIQRKPRPAPWSEGEKIPWNEAGFSARMLREHLSQDHDAASRRFAIIDRQVDWIHRTVLGSRPGRILDLGCGPGLYASRLARLGHDCSGVDFSPASIAYAREQAAQQGQSIRYVEGDIRQADFGSGYGLVMFIFGEFNVFRPEEASLILRKAHAALDPGGILLLEPHTFEAVRQIGAAASSWYSSEGGLFSEDPHLCLMENFWDADSRTATERYFVVEAGTGAVTPYGSTMQAYTNEEYRSLIEGCGFGQVEFHPSLAGVENPETSNLLAITARC